MQKLFKIWTFSASFFIAWSAYDIANVLCLACWTKTALGCAELSQKIFIESGIILTCLILFVVSLKVFKHLADSPRQIIVVILFVTIVMVAFLEVKIGLISQGIQTITVIPKALLSDTQQFGKTCF